MTSEHNRLAAAVSEAMAARQLPQSNLARASGVTQSMISGALLGKMTLKEEKWRLLCETLGLNYDAIVASSDDAPSDLEDPSAASDVRPDEPCATRPANTQNEDNLLLLALYAEGRLAKDIEAGMKVDPMKLWGILDAVKKIKDRNIAPE